MKNYEILGRFAALMFMVILVTMTLVGKSANTQEIDPSIHPPTRPGIQLILKAFFFYECLF